MRVAEKIELDAATERELRALAKGRRVEARLQQRARVILLAAQGLQSKDIAVEVDLDRRQVALWRGRFLKGGIDALRQSFASLESAGKKRRTRREKVPRREAGKGGEGSPSPPCGCSRRPFTFFTPFTAVPPSVRPSPKAGRRQPPQRPAPSFTRRRQPGGP